MGVTYAAGAADDVMATHGAAEALADASTNHIRTKRPTPARRLRRMANTFVGRLMRASLRADYGPESTTTTLTADDHRRRLRALMNSHVRNFTATAKCAARTRVVRVSRFALTARREVTARRLRHAGSFMGGSLS